MAGVTPPQKTLRGRDAERRARLGRLLLSLPLVAYIAGAPALRAVTGEAPVYLRGWAMFDGAGRGVCSVDFRDGAGLRIDRYRPFGAADFRAAPDGVRFLANEEEARALALSLCPSLAPGERVIVLVQCPSPDGWQEPSRTELACDDRPAPVGVR